MSSRKFTDLFVDDQVCRDYIQFKRWGNTIRCVHCNGAKVYKYADKITLKCAKCRRKFRVTTGTIFEDTHLPLTDWFDAMYDMASDTLKVQTLANELCIPYKTAWFLKHRIKETTQLRPTDIKIITSIGKIDEVFIGANKFKMPDYRKDQIKKGSGRPHCSGILAIYSKTEGLIGFPVTAYCTREDVEALIKQVIDPSAIVYTDASRIYDWTDSYFEEGIQFNHAKKVFGYKGQKDAHTNDVEGCFKHFKTIIRVNVSVGIKYLYRYWNFFAWKYNCNNLLGLKNNVCGIFDYMFGTIDRRLTMQQLKGSRMTEAKVKSFANDFFCSIN